MEEKMEEIKNEKSVMMHIRSEETLKKYISIQNGEQKYDIKEISSEVRNLTKEFLNQGWTVYLTSLDNIDIQNKMWKNVYCVNNNERYDFDIQKVNEKIKILIIRNVGSVEGNFEKLRD